MIRRGLIAFSLFALARDAYACSCIMENDPLSKAEVAFEGTVLKTNLLEEDSPRVEPKTEVIFTVTKTLKGEVPNSYTVYTKKNKYTCDGFSFEEKRAYRVYLSRDENGMKVSVCNGTVPLDR